LLTAQRTSRNLGAASEGHAGSWAKYQVMRISSPKRGFGRAGRAERTSCTEEAGWGFSKLERACIASARALRPSPSQPPAHPCLSQNMHLTLRLICRERTLLYHIGWQRTILVYIEPLYVVPTTCPGPCQPKSLTTPTHPSRFAGCWSCRRGSGRQDGQNRACCEHGKQCSARIGRGPAAVQTQAQEGGR